MKIMGISVLKWIWKISCTVRCLLRLLIITNLLSSVTNVILNLPIFTNIQTGFRIYETSANSGSGQEDESNREVSASGETNATEENAANDIQNVKQKHKIKISPDVIQARRQMIRDCITYSSDHTLIVWCPLRQLRPDTVATVCGSIDNLVEIRNRWIPDAESSQKVWGGAMVIFRSKRNANMALIRLRNYYSSAVVAIPLRLFFHLYIEADIRYPKFGTEVTRIRICGNASFLLSDIPSVIKELYQCGTAEYIEFRDGVEQYGVICEVDYKCASYAFVAKTVMNGMFFASAGSLSVEIVQTKMVRDITKYCTGHLRKWLSL